MRLILVFALLLFALTAATQTNQVYLEKRTDGWWATWSNTPSLFKISTSTNMANWVVWMRKESGESLKSMEMKLVNSNDYKFLKFEAVGPYYPPPSLTNLLNTLTNKLKQESIKRKARK